MELTTLPLGPTTARVWTAGAGEAIVLLHGPWAGAEPYWSKVADELAKSHRVIAPELPGIGVPGDLLPSFGAYAAWLDALDETGRWALLKLITEPKAVGQVINIGNVQEVTINQLAERVRELTGSKSPIKHIPYDEAYESGFEDMPRRVPDLRKIAGLIGYKPQHNLDDILTQVIAYFRRK